jgi:hypothetical protein
VRLDHLLSKEIPGHEDDRILRQAYRSLVVSFERATLFQPLDHPFGGDGGGEPRVPIPNTTVKPSSANGTWTAGSWESRTSPSGCCKASYVLVDESFLKSFGKHISEKHLHLENWITKEQKC